MTQHEEQKKVSELSFNDFINKNKEAIRPSAVTLKIPVKIVLDGKLKEEVEDIKMSFLNLKNLLEEETNKIFYEIGDEYFNLNFIKKIIVDPTLYQKVNELYILEEYLNSRIDDIFAMVPQKQDKNVKDLKKTIDKKQKLMNETLDLINFKNKENKYE